MATNLGKGGVVGKMTRDQFAKHARAATPFDPVDGVEITGMNLERLQKAMRFLGWADPRFVTAAEAEKNGWAVMPNSSSVGIKVRDPVKGSYADVFLFNAENVSGMPGLAAMLAMTDEEIAKMQELGGVEDELSIVPAREIVREVGGHKVKSFDVLNIGEDDHKSYHTGIVRLEDDSLLQVEFDVPLGATENEINIEAEKTINAAIESKRLAVEQVVTANLEENFSEWVRDNYSGMEYEEIWNHRIQSGEYPEEFLDEVRTQENLVANATTAAIAGTVVDDGRFAVMAPYWQDNLHNAEGVALAAEINATITDRGLAEDKEAIERLLAIYPKARRLGIEVVPERVFLADPHLKANLAEPRFLLGGALVRDEDGAYRPYGGGLAVLVDKGDSLVLKSRDKDGYAAAMELAIAKGWTAIELKGKPAMLAGAWLEARLKGLDVVNYEPTEKDMERYQERVAEESRARAAEAGVPEVEGAPGVAVESEVPEVDVESDELVVAPGRTIEQGPERVAYRTFVDAEGQNKTAMVTYTVSQEVGAPETFGNPKDAARAFSRIDAVALPAVVRSVTRADGYVEADVQVAGTGMAKGGKKPVKSADAVLAHEFAEAFVAVNEEERVKNGFGHSVENGVVFSGKVVGSGQDEKGRSFVDQKIGIDPGNVVRHYLESGVKVPVNGAVLDILRGRNGKAKVVEKELEVESGRELHR